MQHARPRLAELPVHRVAQQWVREVVHDVLPLVRLDQHVCAPQLRNGAQQLFGGEIADGAKHVVGNANPDDRRQLRHGERLPREPLDAREKEITDVGGQLKILQLPAVPASIPLAQPSGANERLDRLLEKERIAAGRSVQPARELAHRVLCRAEHTSEQLRRGTRRQSCELLRRRESDADERVLGRAEHLAALALGRAVRAENRDARATELPRGEVKQLE